MKKLATYLKDHWREEARLGLLAPLALLLAIGIWWRYGLQNDSFFREEAHPWLWGILFFAIPYFGAVAMYAAARNQWRIFLSQGFWLNSLLVLSVPYINQFWLFYKEWLPLFPADTEYFFRKVLFNLHTATFYVLIPMCVWLVSDRHERQSFYGLTRKGFSAKPYLLMLAIMLPLLAWASFQPDFLLAYPRYKVGTAEYYWKCSPLLTVGTYEITYALQFVFLELFFRGFMTERLRPYLGESAVFPMVAVYCFIHFGKPMAETVGSIFGGYILGVVAMRSGSVLGGVIAHVGVALGMELLAFLQMP